MPIGRKIVELRKEKGWSQSDLGERIRVHARHISRWENDKNIPNAEALKKMAQLFGVTTDYLLFDDAPRNGRIEISDLELLRQFEEVSRLEEREQETIKSFLSAFIAKQQIQELIK